MSARPPRSTAEWVSMFASLAVVLVVVGLIISQMPGNDLPPAPVADIDGIRQVGESFHVDVTVRNDGDKTAANVQVAAELSAGTETATGDQTIDFLSGGQEQALTFVFDLDPADGDIEVDVTGYTVP